MKVRIQSTLALNVVSAQPHLDASRRRAAVLSASMESSTGMTFASV
jgi:hypothetical protein